MKGVRLRDEGWEGQCEVCRQWWALDQESWKRGNLRTCRACQKEDARTRLNALRSGDPEMRTRHRLASLDNKRVKRSANPEAFREYQRRWYAANHVRLMARTAERHAIQGELAGRKTRKSSRIETPETLRIRAEYRAEWIAEHGPIVPTRAVLDRREYNRNWMRRKRAAA